MADALDLFDATLQPILAAPTYAEFKQSLADSNCRRCPLSAGRTNIVVDRGTPTAKVMVIGEAPGENEDLKAQAFVGRAGQMFDKIMASIGIDTNRDFLIANICKCRPPENRAPKKEEAETCLVYLQRQIALVKPRVILLLGATALKHMSGEKVTSMKEKVGQFFELPAYPGIQWMVLYHPAALLYDAKLKPAMWEHVKSLKAFLEKEGLFPAPSSAAGKA